MLIVFENYVPECGFGGLDIACWPLIPKFAGSNPAEAVGFFRTKKKILCTPSFGGEVKPFVPCRIFAACKRTRKCMRGSRSFRSKLPAISRPIISSFRYQGLWWRHLAVQVGMTKDQGLYNKPSAAVHLGTLAAGILLHTYIHVPESLAAYLMLQTDRTLLRWFFGKFRLKMNNS